MELNTIPLITGSLPQFKTGTSQKPEKSDSTPPDPAREAAQDFESMVIGVMLEPMFSGIKTDGPFGGGQSEAIYRSLLVQEYAKSISSNGGIGIADSVYKEMLKLQGLH